MDSVNDTDIPPTEFLHHRSQGAWLEGSNEEVNVIAHQDICVHLAVTALRGVLQALQIETSVRIAEEACAAVVAALDHVVRNTGQFEARRPRHAPSTRLPSKGFSAGKLLLENSSD